MHRPILTFCIAISLFSTTSSLLAGLVTDFQTSSASQTAFPVSATDLINQDSPSLDSYSAIGYTAQTLDSYGPVSALIDGDAGGSTGFQPSPGGVQDADGTFAFIVNLNSSSAPHGYDITTVQTFTGHIDNRKSQDYDLSVSLVGDSSFVPIGHFEFNFDNPNQGSTRLTIADDSGAIARGVDALRWDVQVPTSNTATTYREFDVFGSPTIPTPESSTLILGGLGLTSLTLLGRRRLGLKEL